MDDLYLSVDLGGTSLRIAILDSEATFIATKVLASESVRKEADFIDCLVNEFSEITQDKTLAGRTVGGAALGIPGLVDSQSGLIYQSPHFPQWKDFALGSLLKPYFSFSIHIDNDANKAALGEAWKGAGQNWNDFIMLTLGTGVGAGIVWNRKIFHGSEGTAGEVGHVTIDRNGESGALGIKGTLETFASLSGLKLQMEKLRKAGRDGDLSRLDADSPRLPEELARLAKAGNEAALALWKGFGEALACGIASLANILGIFNFIIGGGLAGAWDLYISHCRDEISRRTYEQIAKKIQIVPARLGSEAGLIGGVPMIRQQDIK